ncbi:MAG: N-acetylmuramoyl-L-alanine amidase [Pseudomonadota bacterium]
MKRTLALWSVVILSLCGVLALAQERPTAPEISAVRLGVDGKGQTRIVLDMDERPRFSVTPKQVGERRLLTIEVDQAQFNPGIGMPAGKGIVRNLKANDATLQVELNKTGLPEKMFILDPTGQVDHYRLVIDVSGVPSQAFAKALVDAVPAIIAGKPAPKVVAKTPPSPKVKRDRSRKTKKSEADEIALMISAAPPLPSVKPKRGNNRSNDNAKLTIVLDPGHGGRDPGAIGSTGLREKVITLSAAKTLASILEKRGYRVILTRRDDTYVKHEDRIDLARDTQADMFISIHADANAVKSVSGGSVYTLSDDRSAKMAKDAAESGNFRVFDLDASETDRDVSSILYDLASTDTKNQSARLATALISEMKDEIPMVRNTHRKAGLLVLLSPDVPAVLVEMAFLSNKKDEANLGSKKWRRRAVTAVADGIDLYFNDTTVRRAAVNTPPSASTAQ